jgi:hypothetical protein
VLAERASLADLPGIVFANLPSQLRERYGAPFPAARPERPILAEISFTRRKDLDAPWGARFNRERHALYADRFKFILSSDGSNELYDLASDPREERNLIAQKGPLAQALETRLRAILSAGAAPNTRASIPELSPADLDELRRLGYL